MEFEVDLTVEDQVAFSLWGYRRRTAVKVEHILMIVFGIIALGQALLQAKWSTLGLTAAAIAFILYNEYRLPGMARRELAKNNVDTIHVTYNFSAEGIQFTVGGGTGQVAWADVSQAVETKPLFVFFLAQGKAYIAPKHNLSDTQKDELKRLLKEYLPANKLRLQA